ncbi:HAD family hydrolase [Haloactinomyces albus]|uniref:HAD superfamily hydrolase (TIGR01509 family) n=1 Tax=Haloactinomyces albus TaxID=1352928 RepID=A0AAE3ZEF7_9ACTN|nr:HAD family phosphatase [Haloactinomyces albus]MDR7303438.1 HAD superfamily hydrolase (TIGR01509 family) [Haloactinomyces albus]
MFEPHAAAPGGAGRESAELGAVLFDMDGTLVESEQLWTLSLNDYATHRGGALSAATRELLVGSNMHRSMELLLTDLGLPAEAADVAVAAEWVERRTAELFRQGLSWRPGAHRLLHGVRARGIPTALVTSTFRSLTEIAMGTLGRDTFAVTVCGDEVGGRNKPDPEPYLQACRTLGVDPARCVALEDSPTGVAAAVSAGCTVIGVPCEVPLEPGEGRFLYDSLEALDADSLAELLAAPRPPSVPWGTGCKDRAS